MLRGCYTFTELKEKFGWTTKEGSINAQITYAKNRGVEIQPAFKEGKTYFQLISVFNDYAEEWKQFPLNPRYEVSKSGKVRTTDTKKLVGAVKPSGYVIVTDQTQTPTQYYRVHRMVMETFQPIENSENFFVDHIDGNKQNNQLDNLRWVLPQQNSYFRDENWLNITENLQKLIQKRGYDWVNSLILLELEENR